jgi:hypothetical protein
MGLKNQENIKFSIFLNFLNYFMMLTLIRQCTPKIIDKPHCRDNTGSPKLFNHSELSVRESGLVV